MMGLGHYLSLDQRKRKEELKMKYHREILFTIGLAIIMVVHPVTGLHAAQTFYQAHNLVSDQPGVADHTDPNLVNAWGIAFNPNAVVWVADNGTGKSTLYDGTGEPQALIVTVPLPGNVSGASAPTGIVFNSSSNFIVSKGPASGAAAFIFATEDGTISGWNPTVDATNAILMVDKSASGALYKGITLAGNGTAHYLYATDFHNSRVDVFDSSFQPATLSGSFSDPTIPAGYGPFGIQNINGDIYVTYAKQDADKVDDVKGKGFGYVNVFDSNGNLIRRFASKGKLNAPWGLAMAPSRFGKFSNRLLVGNFGDGTINAFDVATGKAVGTLQKSQGKNLTIDGLWGLSFGNGVRDQPTDTLFFTAGPNDEAHGLYGFIEPAP
jgi:uncharacterized protein (TIGR03118 family)